MSSRGTAATLQIGGSGPAAWAPGASGAEDDAVIRAALKRTFG